MPYVCPIHRPPLFLLILISDQMRWAIIRAIKLKQQRSKEMKEKEKNQSAFTLPSTTTAAIAMEHHRLFFCF
ncbi:hypothetical protein RIF29_28178 [Crotalaria pallida]|uniref:Uncharacterized protein n=1 Tax=Crotalaria pallida TaxID=3830 RepID=A0AAN9EV94_CROPI